MRPFARLCFQPQWRRCGPQALATVLAPCGLLPQPLLTLSSGPRLLLGTTRPAPGCPDAPSGPPRLPPRWTRSSLVFPATQVLLPAQPLAWYPPLSFWRALLLLPAADSPCSAGTHDPVLSHSLRSLRQLHAPALPEGCPRLRDSRPLH